MVVLSLALALLVASPLVSPAPGQTETPIDDPIPEDPIVSGLGLTLEEFVTMPPSEPSMPPTDPRLMRWARINYLGEVPDGSGRLFVPDLNGKMYLIEDGRRTNTSMSAQSSQTTSIPIRASGAASGS
jgi:hypothetical protein